MGYIPYVLRGCNDVMSSFVFTTGAEAGAVIPPGV